MFRTLQWNAQRCTPAGAARGGGRGGAHSTHTHFHTYVLTALLLGNHAFCRGDEVVCERGHSLLSHTVPGMLLVGYRRQGV